MRRSNSVFWGGLLLLIGIGWLLRNMGFLQFNWQEISRFWPVLLILAGVIVLASGQQRRGVGGGIAGILIALAVLGGITHRTERALNTSGNNWNFKWDEDDDEWNFGDRRDRRERDRGYDQEEADSTESDEPTRKMKNQHYEYDMEADLREATLNFEGGAGEFKLKGTTDKLFEAESQSSLGGFESSIRNNRNENTASIDFKMENNQVKLKDGDIKNKVEFKLNPNAIWNIDLGLGAGKADFDLSDHKVKSLKVSTGVADLELRLGNNISETNISIESGVASVSLEIPEAVGCEIRIDGALNIKTLDDFTKVSDGVYRTPGYANTTRKILINYEGGLSKVKIRRY